jgi:hypothetical protein
MSNNFYNHSGFPAANANGSSATMRAELDSIAAGFDKLPALTGNGDKAIYVNTAGTALEARAVTGVPASSVSFTPTGTIASTDVQAAVAEAASEALQKSSNLSDVANAATARTNLSVGGLADNNTWTGTQTFRDNKFAITDDSDTSKVLNLQLSGITTATTRTLTVPDANITIAGTNTAQTFTVSQRATVTTDNDLSFDLSATNNFSCTPSAGGTLTFTNHTAGQSGFIKLVNGSNYAIAAAATTKISTADLTKISATGTYIISYFDDGTNAYCVASASLA